MECDILNNSIHPSMWILSEHHHYAPWNNPDKLHTKVNNQVLSQFFTLRVPPTSNVLPPQYITSRGDLTNTHSPKGCHCKLEAGVPDTCPIIYDCHHNHILVTSLYFPQCKLFFPFNSYTSTSSYCLHCQLTNIFIYSLWLWRFIISLNSWPTVVRPPLKIWMNRTAVLS